MADVTIFLDIAIILFMAKLFGELAERVRLSSMVGEIFGGILAGPVLGLVHPGDLLGQIANFGILFLLFIIGLETDFDEVKGNMYPGIVLGFAGDMLAVFGGFLVGYLLFGSANIGIVLGICILSTSTAITLRSLISVGENNTKVFKMALAMDMADEVVAILALSLLTTYFMVGAVEIWKVASLFLSVLGLFLFILTAGAKIIGNFLRIFQVMRDEHILLSIPIVVLFVVAFLTEHVGVAGVTGAFLAGLAMSKAAITKSVIVPKMKIIGYGFFIPIFFAYSALILDLTVFSTSLFLIVLLILVGVTTKIIGAGLLARIYDFNLREQLVLGASMVPRGEYSIIIAQIALAASIINRQLYTVVIAFVLVSIIITPIILRAIGSKRGYR